MQNKKEGVEWHALSEDDVLKQLDSKKEGLDVEEAKRRLETYGKNELKEIHRMQPFMIFLSQFNSFFIYLLIIAALISLFVAHMLDFYAILAIIIINGFIGFFQNYKAERAIQNLKRSLVPKARVLRKNILYEISASEIVPGDILVLQEGDKIVADARIIESQELQANEAVLTGESMPVDKSIKKINAETPLAERLCMLYSGTTIVRGSCKALVVSTGMSTEFGKIASLVQEAKAAKTPLQEKLDNFAKKIGFATIALCIAIAGIGISLGLDKMKMFLTSVSLAVAAVPEGLPAVITICLAIAVQRMYKVKSLIRKLPAAETLGRVTVICSDKTGTMTEEKMKVIKFFFNDKIQNEQQLHESLSRKDETADMLMKINCLCNNARVEKMNNNFVFYGDPTEQALLRAAIDFGFDKEKLTAREPREKEFAFTSARKMMSITRYDDGKLISYVKGAPEVIIEKCKHEFIDGKFQRISEKKKTELLETYKELAQQGLRVLGFAFKSVNEKFSQKDAENDLVFVGFQGMLDPPRREVKPAVQACQEAGIAVKMITGDSELTAKAVAYEIGLKGETLAGNDIENMSDEELKSKLKDISIFARTSPEQKLRIIMLLKQQREIVAVTGDGVNDAPALKKADIGIAMGIRGTDVARDVSDIILVDDNFASIVEASKEGRRVFDNIKKFSYYLLSSNLAEIFIVLFALLLGAKIGWPATLVLLPLQLLWINLISDGIIAITLSFENAEEDIMRRKPEKGDFFTKGMLFIWFAIALIITAGILVSSSIIEPVDAVKMQTIAFTGLVFFEGFNAFNFRSFRQPLHKLKLNVLLFIAVIASFLLQILIVSVPAMQNIFGTAALSLKEWLIIGGLSVSILVIGEIFKITKNMKNK